MSVHFLLEIIMVKIINEVPHPSITKEVVCKNCGCTLSYTPNDVDWSRQFDYGGGSDLIYHIVCPKCTHKVSVSKF